MRQRPPQIPPPAGRLSALVLLALPALAGGAQPATPPAAAALAACASIGDSAARLACYDELAGRGAAPAPAARPAAQAAGAPAPAPAAAAEPAGPAPAAAAAPGSTAPGAGGPAQVAAPAPSTQSFGLYEAEHPKPPPVSPALVAGVVALGHSAGGRMTVTLDGGALWEMLDDGDPLLAVGDTVTVKRAALGSYLMSTPSKRTHRVRRLD
jgi:hypothetical protein